MLAGVFWGLTAWMERFGKASISPCEFSGCERPSLPLLLQDAWWTCRKVFPGLLVIYIWCGCRGILNPEMLLTEAQWCMHADALHPGPYHHHQECNRLGVYGVFLNLGLVGKGAMAGEQLCMEHLWIQLVSEAPAAPDSARLHTQLMLEVWRGSVLCLVQEFLSPAALKIMAEVHSNPEAVWRVI